MKGLSGIMKKRILSVCLTMLLILSSVVTADAKENLKGTEWWKGSSSGMSYALANNTTVSFDVDVQADVNGYAAFSVEVREGTHCITSSSDGNCFYFADGGTTGDAITGVAEKFASKVVGEEEYRVSITREEAKYTIVYYNVTTNTEEYRYVCANTNMTGDSTVNFIAQVGTYDVTVNGSKQNLKGTEWWKGSSSGMSYALANNTTVSFDVDVQADVNGYAAFSVEVREGTHCITSSSDGNCFYFADGGTTGDAITGVAEKFASKVVGEEEYRVSITREEAKYTIVYYNVTTNTEEYRYVCANTNMTGNSTVNFIAQVGTYNVEFKDANYIDISSYRSGSTYTAPTKEGKVFAGWYADAEFTTPIGKDVKTGYAYAKFADEKLLTAKCQARVGTTESSEKTDIRMMLGVDSLNYSNVGFDVTFKGINYNGESKTVYESISVTDNGTTVDYSPATVFGTTDATYMLSCILTDIAKADFDEDIKITPYWTTLDGTKVIGKAKKTSINVALELS